MKITGDKNLDELLTVVKNTIEKVGSYKVQVEDRFIFIPEAKDIIRKALQRYWSKKIQALYSKV